MEREAVKIGTITLKGTRSIEFDGLYMGDCNSIWVFKLTTEGLERKGKLYKTFDIAYLAPILGFSKFTYTTKYEALQ
uniref:Uncharacterized protein n=1 Tax=viral metagenome TaxID=1070528 RepID=A0A6M3LEM5_9ZZZZ